MFPLFPKEYCFLHLRTRQRKFPKEEYYSIYIPLVEEVIILDHFINSLDSKCLNQSTSYDCSNRLHGTMNQTRTAMICKVHFGQKSEINFNI